MNSSDLHRKLSTEPVLSSGIRSKGKTSDRPTLPFFTHSAINTWKAAWRTRISPPDETEGRP